MTFSDWSWPILFWRFFSALISVMMSHLKFFFLLFTLWLAFLSLTFLSCVSQDSAPSSLFFSLSSESFSYWNTIFNYPFHVDDSCVIHRRPTHKLLVYVMIPPRCSWFSHLSGQLSYSCLILPMRPQNPSQNTEYSVLLLIDEKKKKEGGAQSIIQECCVFSCFCFGPSLEDVPITLSPYYIGQNSVISLHLTERKAEVWSQIIPRTKWKSVLVNTWQSLPWLPPLSLQLWLTLSNLSIHWCCRISRRGFIIFSSSPVSSKLT